MFDAIYTPKWTRLLQEAQESGAAVVFGTEMLLNQAFVQIENFSGVPGKFDTKDFNNSSNFLCKIVFYFKPHFQPLSYHFLLLPCSPNAAPKQLIRDVLARNT